MRIVGKAKPAGAPAGARIHFRVLVRESFLAPLNHDRIRQRPVLFTILVRESSPPATRTRPLHSAAPTALRPTRNPGLPTTQGCPTEPKRRWTTLGTNFLSIPTPKAVAAYALLLVLETIPAPHFAPFRFEENRKRTTGGLSPQLRHLCLIHDEPFAFQFQLKSFFDIIAISYLGVA